MRRLLILACGATKRPDAHLLPALDRYDGPPYRTLRKALAQLAEEQRPTVLILSAEFGLIPADALIPDYDRRMTASRATSLRSQARAALAETLAQGAFEATMINLGADYLPGLPLDPETVARLGALTYTRGGIGERMSHMKRWVLNSSPAHTGG
jgi:cytoplasmic iron level regulating protein YaaA (DUF328/UPF0246 family)